MVLRGDKECWDSKKFKYIAIYLFTNCKWAKIRDTQILNQNPWIVKYVYLNKVYRIWPNLISSPTLSRCGRPDSTRSTTDRPARTAGTTPLPTAQKMWQFPPLESSHCDRDRHAPNRAFPLLFLGKNLIYVSPLLSLLLVLFTSGARFIYISVSVATHYYLLTATVINSTLG